MIDTLNDLYLEYLYDQSGLPKRGRNRSHYKLFQQMYSKEFVWLLLKDSSRSEDGKEFRWEFIAATGIKKVPADWLYRPCSVLEMIFGVARRLAVLTDGDQRAWFAQLLYNLGFDDCNDLRAETNVDRIDETLESLIWRTYQTNGKGGLFPLHNPPDDQRSVEIWYQMNAWLIARDRREV